MQCVTLTLYKFPDMNLRFAMLFSISFAACLQAQAQKFDTTVKMGDQGYKVSCNNKNADKNEVAVNPVNLKFEGMRPVFTVLGKVKKAFAEDMNDDGRPDLMICTYTGDSTPIGSVVSISFNAANKNFEPIYFPDIYLDAKLREGYRGYDEFSALTGTLMRKFPLYLPGDATGNPTGGTRIIQYKPAMENGHLAFKVLRSFDAKP